VLLTKTAQTGKANTLSKANKTVNVTFAIIKIRIFAAVCNSRLADFGRTLNHAC